VSASRFLDECGSLLVGHSGDVQLVGEALLEPIAHPHVDRVDPVEGLLARRMMVGLFAAMSSATS